MITMKSLRKGAVEVDTEVITTEEAGVAEGAARVVEEVTMTRRTETSRKWVDTSPLEDTS
jgi:hypothetical protein